MKAKTIISITFLMLIFIQSFSQQNKITTVTAVSNNTSCTSSNATNACKACDASGTSTYWSPQTNNSIECITFDLGATNAYNPTQIVITFNNGYQPYSFTVSGSTSSDCSNTSGYSQLANLSGTFTFTINLPGTTLYRYIKLTNLNVYNGGPAQLSDFSVYCNPNASYNNVTVNGTLNSSNINFPGNFNLNSGVGSLTFSGNSSSFMLYTDRPSLVFGSPVNFNNSITVNNINSTGDCVVQGAAYQNGTPGSIKLGKAYLNNYPYGGDVTISAGTGFHNGNITLNAPANNGGGSINLNGATYLTGTLTVTGAMSAGSLTTTGNVGIGVTNTNGYQLAVGGNMIAEKVVVKSQTNWPDFVFSENYKLNSISELEEYLKINKHLSDVPTQEQIKEKGIDIAEMNSILLKKIEEITLLLIEQDKKISAQEKEIELLKNAIRDIKK